YQLNSIDDNDSFDLKEMLKPYLKRWPLFAGTVAIALLLAYLVNQFTPPKYLIESKFLIKEEESMLNIFDAGELGNNGLLPKGQKVANEIILLKSRVTADRTLDQLAFDVEYLQEGTFINKELYSNIPIKVEVDWSHIQLTNGLIQISWTDDHSFQVEFIDRNYTEVIPNVDERYLIAKPDSTRKRYESNEWIESPFSRFRIQAINTIAQGSILIKLRDRESLINQYTGDNLQISSADKLSSIVSLSLETTQPQKGRDYLNTLMKVSLDKELDEKNSIARNTINFIDNQLSGISDSLSNSQSKLENFRSTNRTNNLSLETNTIYEELGRLEQTLAAENFKKNYYENLQRYMVREEYTDLVVPSGIGIEDPVLNKLINDLITLQSEKSRLLSSQTESSPTVVSADLKIRSLNASIKEVLNNVIRNADVVVTDLQKRIRHIEGQFGRLPKTEQELLNIKRNYTLNESIYTFLVQRRAQASISLASNKPSNKISETAVLTFEPMKLKPMLNYFLALMLGFIIPFVSIFIYDSFATKITDVKEVEQKLIVPFLGSIGQNKNYGPLVVFDQPRAGITEYFRGIRTNINFLFPRDKPVTIMMTSTIAGEGKTFCAMNLAAVYSIGAKKTILVGCDMRKPFNFKDLSISNKSGLSTYLSAQNNELKSIIQKTSHGNFDVIAPGPIPPNPAELLISDQFQNMLNELKQTYEVIILDSSPIGITTDTLYLTQIADITIYVLRHGVSEKSFINDVNDLKLRKGVKNIYVVLNDVEEKYLPYSGYGYGYYREDHKQSTKKRKKNLNTTQ
ncbi:MAG TPA: polysaccharide biosynthesis tyrosine autokinase, partial [Chryseolinea sp.]|nr:polysaccharide biosynthesis tyrosine autokinase [Chryseolinea sp.]